MVCEDRIKRLQTILDRCQGTKDRLMSRRRELRATRDRLVKEQNTIVLAQALVQEVAIETQKELEFHVSSVASLALNAVFSDPYELLVHFEPRRGKSEAMLTFLRDGIEFNPMEATGGGAVDLAAFSLRVSMLTLRKNARKVIMMDEPFRFLSKDLHSTAGEVVRELSQKLGIQFIMVTHERAITEVADRVFTVTKNGDRSVVSVN